ncbi:hypothetical protein JDV09_09155 [Mycobacterium sp. Y57]|uniref:hypothetical protein n=1 Tax=Mycolicibacterium xanthum TaxID=2796469 RepID=UPI001C841BB0|nr:hypothetical protein [Mycolicibacterium xanthum]MBX7432272.1 hypothetical protein [Mycolicibacterium xanthum]
MPAGGSGQPSAYPYVARVRYHAVAQTFSTASVEVIAAMRAVAERIARAAG